MVTEISASPQLQQVPGHPQNKGVEQTSLESAQLGTEGGDLLKGANNLTTLPRWEETLPGRFPRDKFLRRSSGHVHLEKQGEGPFVLLHMMEVHFYR